jgi:magnesium chelatase family protein
VLAAQVANAYQLQLARQGKPNQQLSTREIDRYCKLDERGDKILRDAMAYMHWSARAYHRVLKVARTIADLAGARHVHRDHVTEAVQYRRGLRER